LPHERPSLVAVGRTRVARPRPAPGAGVDIILGCNGMVWIAPHAPLPAPPGADGGEPAEPEPAPAPPPDTRPQREAVCRAAGAVRALAALRFLIFPAALAGAWQARVLLAPAC